MVGSLPTYQYVPSEKQMIALLGSEAAVRKEYKKLRDITHKRVVRLQKQNLLDASVLRRYETGIPEAKKMTTAEIVREMATMVRLLDYRKTSSVTGVKEVKKMRTNELKKSLDQLKKAANKMKEEKKKAKEKKKAEKAGTEDQGPGQPVDQPAGDQQPIEVLDEYVNDFLADLDNYGPSYGDSEDTEDEPEDEEIDFDEILEYTQDIIDMAESLHMESELYKKYGGGKSGFDAMSDEIMRSGLYKSGDPAVGLQHFLNQLTSDFRQSKSMY